MSRYAWIAVGALVTVAGIALPPEAVVRAALPAAREAFFGKLVAGLWCWKVALVLAGLSVAGAPWLKRWLWDRSAGLPARRLLRGGVEPWDRRDGWVLAGLCAVALVLRLIGSGQSLFGDEVGVQQRYIERGLPVILTFYAHGTPPHVMYSVLAFFFQKLPVPLEVAYRLPAILFGVAAVGLGYRLARRVLDRWLAAVAGVCQAAALFGIVYSHNAKGYSATHFFALLAVAGLLRVAEDWRSARGWVWFGVAGFGMLWMHLYNVYLWAGLLGVWVAAGVWLTWGDGALQRAWLGRTVWVWWWTALALGLVYAVQLPQIYELFVLVTDKPEEPVSWNSVRGWLAQLTFWGTAWPVALVCAGVAGVGLARWLRRESWWAIVWLVPVGVIWGMAWWKEAWIYPRYLVFTLPVFVMLLVEGSRFLGRAGVVAVGLLFLVPNARVLREYYRVGNQDLRGAVRLAESVAQPGDVLAAYGLARDLIVWYGPQFVVVKSPEELARLRAEAPGRVIIVYGWRHAWRSQEALFRQLDAECELVGRLPGFLMDSTVPDGDMFVLVSRRASP